MTDWFLHVPKKDAIEMTNIHVMVDIETMGVGVQAPLLTIGAVLFDPKMQSTAESLAKRSTLIHVEIEEAVKHSGGVEGGTLAWWLGQDNLAIKGLLSKNAVSMETALQRFRQFCIDRNPKLDDLFFQGHSQLPQACAVWAKSPDFDCKNMEDKYQRVYDFSVEQRFPLPFYQFRCVRTLQDLAWPGGPDDIPKFQTGTKHDARADAIQQAMVVQAGYRELRLADGTFDNF